MTLGELLPPLSTIFPPSFQYQFISRNEICDGDSHRFFTVWMQTAPRKPSGLSILKTRLSLELIDHDESNVRNLLKEGQARLRMALEAGGLRPRPLTNADIFRELGGFFRPSDHWKFQHLLSLRQSDLIIEENRFHYDHTFWGGTSVLDLPDQMTSGQMANLCLSNFNSFICTKIVPKHTEKIIDSLKRNRKVSAALTNTKSRLRDLESEAKLQSEDDLLEGLIVGQEKVFDCQVSVFYSTLANSSQTVASAEVCDGFRSMGFHPYREAASLYPVFQSCLPGLPAEEQDVPSAFLLRSILIAGFRCR